MKRPSPWLVAGLASLLVGAGIVHAEQTRRSRGEIDWSRVRSEAAELLSGYVQIDTTNPPGNELAGAEYLKAFFDAEAIPAQIYVAAPGRGNIVARLAATRGGDRRPILLLSHIDVVPADPTAWSFPPFSGAIRDGVIYGRGTLDDKGHGIVFAMALALLKQEEVPRNRDLVFCATADEEVGGAAGAAWMVEKHWEALGPPSVVWNEGGASASTEIVGENLLNGIATTEKREVWLRLVAEGEGGHGSEPVVNGANDRLIVALARIGAYQTPLHITPTVAEQFRRMSDGTGFPLSFVFRHLGNPLVLRVVSGKLTENRLANAMVRDTIALTGLRSGLKHNVIPRSASANLDIRLLPDTDAEGFLETLKEVIGDDSVRLENDAGSIPEVIPASPWDHELFRAIETEMTRELPGSIAVPLLTVGGTDSRLFRRRGVPAYGYNPALYTPEIASTIHGLDEHIPLEELERAIRVTYRVLRRLTR
jgi:acetylornithine deacetylase/succinyl-diaminopimelate desuccinylase-like protein